MNRNQTAVICGGTAGVGRATAHALAKAGYRVAVIARGEQGLADTCQALEAYGTKVLAISADVADAAAIDRAAERIESELGPIEIWVNAAMATVFGPAQRISAAEFKRVTEVTYLGFVHGTLAALRHMQPRDHGTIVQVGSALSYRAIPLQSAYCAAKFAIRGFTDSLRCELSHAHSQVHLTMVQLSAFNTPQFEWGRTTLHKRPRPMGRIFQPELAARGVYWAATHRRRELWVGWPAAQAILGTRVLPGLLDRLLGRTAVDGQHTDEPLPPGRRDNLYAPVPGDHGAHGRFDALATPHSAQFWATTHRGWLAAGAAAALGAWWLARAAFARRR